MKDVSSKYIATTRADEAAAGFETPFRPLGRPLWGDAQEAGYPGHLLLSQVGLQGITGSWSSLGLKPVL